MRCRRLLHMRGGWLGASACSQRRHLVRAALEQADALRQRLQRLGPAGHQQVRRAVDEQRARQQFQARRGRRQHAGGLGAGGQHEQPHRHAAGRRRPGGADRARARRRAALEHTLPQLQFAALGLARAAARGSPARRPRPRRGSWPGSAAASAAGASGKADGGTAAARASRRGSAPTARETAPAAASPRPDRPAARRRCAPRARPRRCAPAPRAPASRRRARPGSRTSGSARGRSIRPP